VTLPIQSLFFRGGSKILLQSACKQQWPINFRPICSPGRPLGTLTGLTGATVVVTNAVSRATNWNPARHRNPSSICRALGRYSPFLIHSRPGRTRRTRFHSDRAGTVPPERHQNLRNRGRERQPLASSVESQQQAAMWKTDAERICCLLIPV
jgi:hypothetical protein